jgi:hypothetical protein
VDGAVLEVILRKAAKIREELGVPVPVPDEGHKLTEALLKAVLWRDRSEQTAFDFMATEPGRQLDLGWKDAADKAKKNRTVFAQRRLKPDDVLPEWKKTLEAIGGAEDVRRFTDRAMARLGSGLEPMRRGFKASLSALPSDVRERLEAEGLAETLFVDFANPPAPRCRPVMRAHPLVSVLAEALLERTLAAGAEDEVDDPSILGRVGCWVAPEVVGRTTLILLRLRHQLVSQKGGQTQMLLVEEASALAWVASSAALLEGQDALKLLMPAPAADPPAHVRERAVAKALEHLSAQGKELDAYAERRAQALLADNRRVREAADARGSYSVRALLPADIIGVFVLLPRAI